MADQYTMADCHADTLANLYATSRRSDQHAATHMGRGVLVGPPGRGVEVGQGVGVAVGHGVLVGHGVAVDPLGGREPTSTDFAGLVLPP